MAALVMETSLRWVPAGDAADWMSCVGPGLTVVGSVITWEAIGAREAPSAAGVDEGDGTPLHHTPVEVLLAAAMLAGSGVSLLLSSGPVVVGVHCP